MPLLENIAKVKKNIAAAARSAGRDPDEVTLVAATKVQSSDTIRAAIGACGLPEDIRGERLGIPEFAALTTALGPF